jgi:hypothetical protein
VIKINEKMDKHLGKGSNRNRPTSSHPIGWVLNYTDRDADIRKTNDRKQRELFHVKLITG